MALDTGNVDSWIAMHDKISDRILKCETELEVLFAKPEYATPLTDVSYSEKADYVLMNISDNKKRKAFSKDFTEALKTAEINKKSIEEDFIKLTNKSLETMSSLKTKMDEAEILIANLEKDKDKFQKEADEMVTKIDEFQKEKDEIDAKLVAGGELEVAYTNAEQAKTDLDNKIQAILDELKRIDDELKAVQDEIDACDPTDRDKMRDLVKKQKDLKNERSDTQKEYDDEYDKYIDVNANINKAKNDINNAILLSNEKQTKIDETNLALSNKLIDINDITTNLPLLQQEFLNDKQLFEAKTTEYTNKAQEVEEKLKNKDIDIHLAKADEIEDISDTSTTTPGGSGNGSNGGPGGGGGSSNSKQTPTTPETTVPAPLDNKRAALDYLTGYSSGGVGLSDTERLDRIKSKLLGRDYQQMIMACTDLSNSDVKLTKQEKDDLKAIFLNDKEMIKKDMESLDKNKFELLCSNLGIDISDDKEKQKVSKLYKNFEDSGTGVLDGFSSMDKDSKALCSDLLKDYYTKKENGILTEDQIKEIEDNFVTPIKFGTLQKQAKEAYSGKLGKFFDKMDNIFSGGGKLGDQKIKDIQSLIANNETPAEVETEAVSSSRSFGENLKNLIEKGNKEYVARSGRKQEPPVK